MALQEYSHRFFPFNTPWFSPEIQFHKVFITNRKIILTNAHAHTHPHTHKAPSTSLSWVGFSRTETCDLFLPDVHIRLFQIVGLWCSESDHGQIHKNCSPFARWVTHGSCWWFLVWAEVSEMFSANVNLILQKIHKTQEIYLKSILHTII